MKIKEKMQKTSPKRVCVYRTETCSRRKLDATKLADYFSRNGYELVDNPKDADIIILVTCAYVDALADISLKKVKQFSKLKRKLIVAGCLPETDRDRLDEIFDGDKISTRNIEKIDRLFEGHRVKFTEIEDAHFLWKNLNERPFWKIDRHLRDGVSLEKIYGKFKDFLLKHLYGERSSIYNKMSLRFSEKTYYIRVSWGCPGKCSYCIVRKAIGPLRSKPLDQILLEFKKGLESGYRNFVICADDIGSYGIDINLTFPDLLREVLNVEGDYCIEIESLRPLWMIKYVDDLKEIFKEGKIVRLGSSIQSGSKRILQLMHRYHDVERMKEVFLTLKEAYPPLIIGTEIIIGFPTEEFEDVKKTLEFIDRIKFDWILIHPYSERRGTESENLYPKVPREEIKRRVRFVCKSLKRMNYYLLKSPWSDAIAANIGRNYNF